MLVKDFLVESAKQFPDKTALVYLDNRFTYSELDRLSDGFAVKLLEKGLKDGSRVAVLLDNSPEYLVSFFAILKSGGVVVPLNTQLVPRELLVILSNCSPRLVITDLVHRDTLKGLLEPENIVIIDTSELLLANKTKNLADITRQQDANQLAMIIYTSGTTGEPKGVMLSHKNLDANANSIIEYLELQPSDSMMVILPFHYSYGISLLTTHIKVGATLVIDNHFLYPNVVLDTMEKEGVTGFAGVPSHYTILLRKSALRNYKLDKLRYVTQAGGAMVPAMIEEFLSVLPGVKFYVMYGQTEATARLTYLNPNFLKEKLGSIGKAIPGVKIDILNEQGQGVKAGEIGEIVVRGDNIMLGYWNAPEETEKVLRNEALFTGDFARRDEDGFIYFVASKKEMIKCGANRISPLEIEGALSQMPGVVECAVVGIRDEILGEAIKLFVVKDNVDISEKDIMLFCKQNLASFRMPKEIELVSALPKTSTGKIKRVELVRMGRDNQG